MSARHILLVDDEPDIREVAAASLKAMAGWEVTSVGSGQEALEKAAADPPDAVLLDVMMPGLDGPATFEALRADDTTRAIPVLLLTAKTQPAEIRRFEELGVDAVIAKPFDPLTLHRRIADELGWQL